MGKNYSYGDAVRSDVWDAVNDRYDWHDYEDRDAMASALYDDLFTDDAVTGNASGSYTFNRAQACEYVGQNLAELADVCEEFGIDAETIGEKVEEENWEYFDVLMRLHRLPEAIACALDELEDAGAWANA